MRKPGPRGMSLVEVMVVVAIVGALSALAVPNLIRLVRSSRVAGDARELQGMLNAARAQAITRGLPVVVCLRGQTWAGAEGLPRQAFSFRKGVPIPPNMCAGLSAAGLPCPPVVVAPGVPGFDPGGAPPDVRGIDLLLTSAGSGQTGVTWVLPIPDNRTMQFVFNTDGQVFGFVSDDCSAVTVHDPLPAVGNTWTVRLEYFADNTINQLVNVRTDGTVILP